MSKKPLVFLRHSEEYLIQPLFSDVGECALAIKADMEKLREKITQSCGIDPGLVLDNDRTLNYLEAKKKSLGGR